MRVARVVAWVLVSWGIVRSAPAQDVRFVRGDANGDSAVDVSDPIATLLHLFVDGSIALGCEDAADANDDGDIDIADASCCLSFLFLGGPPPAAPRGQPGCDPTADALGCLRYGADVERYDPDGNDYLGRDADDECDYRDAGGVRHNWADEWRAAHPGECATCGCAHSKCLNCQLEGRAFWWMMARVAGWDGG